MCIVGPSECDTHSKEDLWSPPKSKSIHQSQIPQRASTRGLLFRYSAMQLLGNKSYSETFNDNWI